MKRASDCSGGRLAALRGHVIGASPCPRKAAGLPPDFSIRFFYSTGERHRRRRGRDGRIADSLAVPLDRHVRRGSRGGVCRCREDRFDFVLVCGISAAAAVTPFGRFWEGQRNRTFVGRVPTAPSL